MGNTLCFVSIAYHDWKIETTKQIFHDNNEMEDLIQEEYSSINSNSFKSHKPKLRICSELI